MTLSWIISGCREQLILSIVEKGLVQEDYGIAVSNGAFDVLSALNAALQKIELGGEYDRIYKKWFRKKPIEEK